MKLNKFKKFFALFFVLIVIIPLTSSLGLWEKLAEAEDAFATGKDAVAEAVDVVSEDTTESGSELVDSSSFGYKFSLGIDEDIYNHDAKFTFNGVEYQGVFRNDFKETEDNMTLKVQDLGTLENPYVVLEVTPSATLSTMRPHVGNLNYFDMTQEELDAITLTEDERSIVRLQTLYQIPMDNYYAKLNEEINAVQSHLDSLNSDLNSYKQRVEDIKSDIETTYYDDIRNALIAENANYQWYIPDDVWQAKVAEFCSHYSTEYNGLLTNITITEQAIVTNTEKLNQLLLQRDSFSVETYVENRPSEQTVDEALTKIEEMIFDCGIMSEEDYNKLISLKLKNALEYKKDYYQSITLNKLKTNNNYNYNLEYETRYAVDSDGNFAFYSDGDTKTVTTTTSSTTHAAIANEIKLTNNIVNPLLMNRNFKYGNDNNRLVVHNDTFTKGCLNTGYNSVMSETGIVLSETPYIDEYVFAGWSVKIGDDLVNVNTLADDYNLKDNGITQLYTNWVVRYYEQEEYVLLTTPGYVSVEFETEKPTYTVMLPDCIASKQSEGGIHDYRNQLTMCVARKNRFFTGWDNTFRGLTATEEICYSEEFSSWDFEFLMDEYKTVADLKKVAPKLMADTDYYVATKNAVVKDGVVTYYPYNVLVITATPEELNKMVYYDAVYNGRTDEVGYQKSEYLNQFLDSVDFVFFSNGGSSLEFSGDTFGYASVADQSFALPVTINRTPNINRCPTLYTYNENGVLTYDKTTLVTSANYNGQYASIPDLEWQVCEKVYQRVAEPKDFAQSGKGQSRSMVVIFDESLGDSVSRTLGTPLPVVDSDGNYINGSGDNLAKLMLMFFGYKEPTQMYQWYMDEDYVEEFNGTTISWDKIKGANRTVVTPGKNEEAVSSFTGLIYGYEQWNSAVFFPYEYFDVNHTTILMDTPGSVFNTMYNPWNGNAGFALYNAIGLARNCDFKKIASPYAYTFNGDNSAASEFFDYTIPEIFNPTNGHDFAPNGSTDLAFEFFRRVNPFKIRNEMISTKDAVKFMIANAQNASLVTAKEIMILNKAEEKTRFSYGTYTMYVDTIFAEDFNKLAENIEYKFVTESEGFYTAEIYWTEQYSQYTKNLLDDTVMYQYLTSLPDDDPLKWYKMPDALDNSGKENYYITYKIDNSVGKDEHGNDVPVRTLTKNRSYYKYFDSNKNEIQTDTEYIVPKAEYYVEALLKPEINDKVWDQRTYLVVVKRYSNYNYYKKSIAQPEVYQPKSVTVKPVVIEKLTYLFNLD